MDNINTNVALKELEELFVAKKFSDAREYLLGKKTDLSPGLFHYNMGVVLGEEGNLAGARYHFEIAKKKGFAHPAIYKNLNIIEQRVDGKIKSEGIYENITNFYVSTPSSVFIFVSLFLSLIALVTLRYIKSRKLITTSVIALLILPTIVKVSYFEQKYSTALSLKEVELFQGPSKVYDVIDLIPAGKKLIISKNYSEWVFIEYPVEFSGWIDRKKVAYY